MSHIFISHSSRDKAYVSALAAELDKRGFEAWIDSTIETSQSWWQEIVRNLNSCAAVIVVMTPEAEESDWVEKELLLAIEQKKKIFPLLLRGQRFSLLVNKQFANVTDGRMPPERFFNTLKGEVPYSATPRTTQPVARSTPALSRRYSLQVNYQNFRGERKAFAVDPKTIRIPTGSGRPSRKHLSMCVAPTGTRIALNRNNILNLGEVERALARYR